MEIVKVVLRKTYLKSQKYLVNWKSLTTRNGSKRKKCGRKYRWTLFRLVNLSSTCHSLTLLLFIAIWFQLKETGEEAKRFLQEVVLGIDFKRHLYNSLRQHEELKFLKKNLKKDEVIISLDFAKNYENKQKNEIQSAYFGHEAFTIFTAALWIIYNISEQAFYRLCAR